MKDSLWVATGLAALTGASFLYWNKQKPRLHSSNDEVTVPTQDVFQVIDNAQRHPHQHPQQVESAANTLVLYQMVCDFTYLFDRFGIGAWATGQTLTGAIRHGGFVPWNCSLEWCAFLSDQPSLGQLFQSNVLRSYSYQAEEMPNNAGWWFYLGSNPEVRAALYWVEPSNDTVTFPSGDLHKLSDDPQCDVPLQNPDTKMNERYWGELNLIEPRRKWAFGATQIYVPGQYAQILSRQDGPSWETVGEDPTVQPKVNTSNIIQMLPWYRAGRKLCDSDFLPATPTGPLQFADRCFHATSRNLDLPGKYI